METIMNFKPYISGREDSKPMNMIVVLNPVNNGARAGKGFMVHSELDQSGFKNLVDENGKVDEKKIANVEAHPRITTSPAFVTNDMARKYVDGGHFVKTDKGNLVGSMRAQITHGIGKGAVWVPDPDTVTGPGWRDTAKCTTAEQIFDQREKSRANAAIKADFEAAKSGPDAPKAEATAEAVVEAETKAAAPEKAAPEITQDEIFAQVDTAAPKAPAKEAEAGAELPF
jgi:hypothetical protein